MQLNVLEKPCDGVMACPTNFHDISNPRLRQVTAFVHSGYSDGIDLPSIGWVSNKNALGSYFKQIIKYLCM